MSNVEVLKQYIISNPKDQLALLALADLYEEEGYLFIATRIRTHKFTYHARPHKHYNILLKRKIVALAHYQNGNGNGAEGKWMLLIGQRKYTDWGFIGLSHGENKGFYDTATEALLACLTGSLQ